MDKKGYSANISLREDGSAAVNIAGEINFHNVESLTKDILSSTRNIPGKEITINMEKVEYFDSAGIAMLLNLRREYDHRSVALKIGKSNPKVRDFLALANLDSLIKYSIQIPKKPHNIFHTFGEFVIEMEKDFRSMVVFIGRLVISMFWNLRHPWKTKWGEVFYLIQRSGAEAFPIVALLSLLIGLVTAFSSAMQLRQFGANIFIADLVGIGMTREMGPLITAIILTGRSGSAFAAEIGTMKISDEIDALTVMRIKPIHYLVMPRLMAVMIVMPILTIFSDLFGIGGGMLISMASLNLTPIAFLNQLQMAIGVGDVLHGLAKAFVFGILIASAGCYRGLKTAGGALGVGKSTTSSVVTGIFLIVLADSVFAILSHYLGI